MHDCRNNSATSRFALVCPWNGPKVETIAFDELDETIERS